MNIIKRTGTANTTSAPGRKIEYLVIHYTAGVSCASGSARGCASWFGNTAAQGSADYIVDEAELVQYNGDPYNRYCWAVGGGVYNTKGGRLYGAARNTNCISLEVCSGNKTGKITYPNDPNYYFTDKVLENAIEATKQLMKLYNIDADHVIRHYDVNGKCCPGVIGWNKDSGSEAKWEAFHKAISGETAKPATDEKEGYTTSEWIAMIAPIAQDLARKYAILPSVVIAQTALETGWGLTDLTRKYNIVGMKADLINGTWKDHSTWDGTTYIKVTPEYVNGQLIHKEDVFRVYHTFRECLEDYENFLLYVRNDKGYKYRRLQSECDPAKVIRIIRTGTGTSDKPEGYCTDPNYETKILNLIKEYKLTQYDTAMPTYEEPEDSKPDEPTYTAYRVWVGSYKAWNNAYLRRQKLKDKAGMDTFFEKEDGKWHVYCGSFSSKENAEKRVEELHAKKIKRAEVRGVI